MCPLTLSSSVGEMPWSVGGGPGPVFLLSGLSQPCPVPVCRRRNAGQRPRELRTHPWPLSRVQGSGETRAPPPPRG